ncbi:hypothetical protein KP509_1Z180600 [Ceratopteris richardii]|nr:hypothetical protein KP509_1Z180600 [Ceratopteris richardii]
MSHGSYIDVPDEDIERMERFARAARRRKTLALCAATVHRFARFCRILSVTWATGVLLGGFVSNLSRWDFYLVTGLLISEAARFFLLQGKDKVLPLISSKELTFSKRFVFVWVQRLWKMRLESGVQFVNLNICALSLKLVRYRLHITHKQPFSDSNTKNLESSLEIFYTLAIILSCIGFASATARLFWHVILAPHTTVHENSLIAYFDATYREAIVRGIVEANEMQLTDFAFTKISTDLEGGLHPLVVERLNKELIHLLYSQNGAIAMTCEYLKSEKVWRRAAAASLPGFWVMENKITLQKQLFWRLRESMYGGDMDAESAINSVRLLAADWDARKVDLGQEYPFLVDDPLAGGNILETLVDIILQKIRPTLCSQVMALAACCRHHLVLDHFYQKLMSEVSLKRDSPELITQEKAQEMLQKLVIFALNHSLVGNQTSDEEVTVASGERDNYNEENLILRRRLGQLCMKLCEIVCPSKSSICLVTKIYASEALVSLFLHSARPICCSYNCVLKGMVDRIMASRTLRGQKIELEDVKAMERVRQLLSLEKFPEWRQFHVLGMWDVLDDSYVESEVEKTRRSVRHLVVPNIG